MNCSLPFQTFVSVHNYARMSAMGSTSEVYVSPDARYVAKRVLRYREFDPLPREVCVLDRLRTFAWAPKLLCASSEYMVSTHVGGGTCDDVPLDDYRTQMRAVVEDMRSVGVRHNDMLKKNTDIVVSPHGRVSLTDFGWGTVDNRLSMRCVVDGRTFVAGGRRPHNQVIDRGFDNTDETRHSPLCPFRKFLQQGGNGSQKETPHLTQNGRMWKISGYQHFQISETDLLFKGASKYAYLQTHLRQLSAGIGCGSRCTLVDIGSNTGLVSFLAERQGFSKVYARDHDAQAISVVQRLAASLHSNVDGQVYSFGDPLPAVHVAFCGAIVHWIFCLTADFQGDFSRILRYISAGVSDYLVIEWVDPADGAIREFHHISRCGADMERKYTRAEFTAALNKVGVVAEAKSFGTRTLFTVHLRH